MVCFLGRAAWRWATGAWRAGRWRAIVKAASAKESLEV